jgi:hypothetical protein
MSLDEKVDKLLVEVTALKGTAQQHSNDLQELKQKLEPVFFHVTGMTWLGKLLGGAIALGMFVVAIFSWLRPGGH